MDLRVYTHGRRDQPKIALTFDDGPNPPRTDQILEILATYEVRATFFVIGKWVERWPAAFERMVAAGHVIGNHSYLHDPDLGDFDRAEAVISHFTGQPSRFLRVHLFHYHVCQQSPLALSSQIKIIDADINPADWSRKSATDILHHMFESQRPQNGSIVDLHDGAETENDALRLARPLPLIEALPTMIERLQADGYSLIGLDEMELVEPKWLQHGSSSGAPE